jgi:hypothetical protein
MTTREKTNAATPLEKFDILAAEIDQLRMKISALDRQRSVDELLEIVSLKELSLQYQVPLVGLRKKLIDAGGNVFKIGKHSVIRRVNLLSIFENLERKELDTSSSN